MAEEKNGGGYEHWGSENIKCQNVGSKLCDPGCCWLLFEVGFPLGWSQTFYAVKADAELQILMVYGPHFGITGKHSDVQHPMTPLFFVCLFVCFFWQFHCLKLACVGRTEIGLLCLLCAEIRGLDPVWLHPKTQPWPTQGKVLVPESSDRRKVNKIKARNKLLGERSVNWFRLNRQRNIIQCWN